MNQFKYSSLELNTLGQNSAHKFSMNHSMMLYQKNALYSFIPKNACSTLRLSTAIENGCIDGIEQGHWIHANNQTFNASLAEAVKIDYSFVVLRCPFRRIASVYLDKFVSKEPDAWQYRDALSRQVELDDLTFRDFVLSLKKPFIFNSNIHWRSQCDFLVYENYSDYFSLEEFPQAISTLKNKINFDVVDARELTGHGTHKYQTLDEQCYADIAAFDIAIMKRGGQCPSHSSLYDKELFALVSDLYSGDLELYHQRCNASNLLNIREVVSPVLDIHNVEYADIKYPFDVDFLRDEALRLESTDLFLANNLMSLALQARPNGPLMKAKLEEYELLIKSLG
jgi:hypothetical protein